MTGCWNSSHWKNITCTAFKNHDKRQDDLESISYSCSLKSDISLVNNMVLVKRARETRHWFGIIWSSVPPKAMMDTLPFNLLKSTSCTIFCFSPQHHDAFHLQFQCLTEISSVIEAGGSQWGAQPWLQQSAHWSNTSQSSSEATKYPAFWPIHKLCLSSFSNHTLKTLCDGQRSSEKAVLTVE